MFQAMAFNPESGEMERAPLAYPDATTAHKGLMTRAQATRLGAHETTLAAIGAVLDAVTAANVALPAATITALVNLTLTEGAWAVFGEANILMGAAAGLCDLLIREVAAAVSRTVTLDLAAGKQDGRVCGPAVLVVVPAATRTVNLAAQSTAAATAQWAAGAIGGNTIWLRAVRIG